MRERLALNVMFLVGRAFRNPGQIVNVGTLSETIKIPSITLAPVIAGLEKDGLLTSNDSEELLPGREMARIGLNDILAVVRIGGETGSHRDPEWAIEIEGLGRQLDGALLTTVAGRSLSDLLDQADG